MLGGAGLGTDKRPRLRSALTATRWRKPTDTVTVNALWLRRVVEELIRYRIDDACSWDPGFDFDVEEALREA